MINYEDILKELKLLRKEVKSLKNTQKEPVVENDYPKSYKDMVFKTRKDLESYMKHSGSFAGGLFL